MSIHGSQNDPFPFFAVPNNKAESEVSSEARTCCTLEKETCLRNPETQDWMLGTFPDLFGPYNRILSLHTQKYLK